MNRDDIIRMADEAKLTAVMEVFEEELARFAALVAAAEREACAKACIDQTMTQPNDDYNGGCFDWLRGEK